MDPGEGPEDTSADEDGPVTQRTGSSFLGEWWDGLKLNPFAKEDTDEDPEEGGGFFGGWFGSGGKEEKPTKEKEQKQPDKSEQAPQSSGKSWFRSPFGGGSNADKEPKSSSGSSFFGASNNDGASGEDSSRSAAPDPGQNPSRGFDGPLGVNTRPVQPLMSPPLRSTDPSIAPALTLLNRSSMRRLNRYDTKEKQRINTLESKGQPIPRNDPSLLFITDPLQHLKAYDSRRDRRRQEHATAKRKGQLAREQRAKAAVTMPVKQQPPTSSQQPKQAQQLAKQKQENKQAASSAAKVPSRRERKAQRKEAAAAATATAASQMQKGPEAEKARSKQAASAASTGFSAKKAPKGPNRRERKAQMKIYVADAARKDKAARAAEAQKRLTEKKTATTAAGLAAKPQTAGKLFKVDPLGEQEKAKANDNMAAFANLPGLGNKKSHKPPNAASPVKPQNHRVIAQKATLPPLIIPPVKVPKATLLDTPEYAAPGHHSADGRYPARH
ncbi:hypothetical protein OOU_Y34scaffold01031g11 [Pyricularia oryzae Y34]|uniref:Uncharacterized protein n=2 Tax=Pyricularia oryzae TaxID=318829 RepID=A0AA97NME8_PYRO3|nr:hypothetical protein OOU_Y34scaffold01031g11 [Pyricularia oryzae Y34]